MNTDVDSSRGGPITFAMTLMIASLAVLFAASLVGYWVTRSRATDRPHTSTDSTTTARGPEAITRTGGPGSRSPYCPETSASSSADAGRNAPTTAP